MKKQWRLAAVAAGTLLIAAACTAPGDGDDGENADPAAVEQAEAEEFGPAAEESMGDTQDLADGPDLDGIPDPVAEVDGTEISKDEFVTVYESQYQQMAMQAQMSGQPVDEEELKEQALEGLVGTTLLEQEAKNRGLEVSDDEIDTALAEFAETNQVSTDEFVSMMGEQGMDRDDVMDQIEGQLLVEKLVDEEYGEFSATDAELEEAYEQIKQQQEMMGGAEAGGQELPPLDEIRDQLEQELESEEQAQNMQTLFEELREDADVTIHL